MNLNIDKEVRFLKLIAIAMPVSIVFIIAVFVTLNRHTDYVISPIIELLNDEHVDVELCQIHLENKDLLIEAFESVTNSKKSGSSPVSVVQLKVTTNKNSRSIELGRDSKDSTLFWVYSEDSKIQGMVVGWIKSQYVSEAYKACL